MHDIEVPSHVGEVSLILLLNYEKGSEDGSSSRSSNLRRFITYWDFCTKLGPHY